MIEGWVGLGENPCSLEQSVSQLMICPFKTNKDAPMPMRLKNEESGLDELLHEFWTAFARSCRLP